MVFFQMAKSRSQDRWTPRLRRRDSIARTLLAGSFPVQARRPLPQATSLMLEIKLER